VQRLVDTSLVGAEGPTALKDEYNLSIRPFAKFIDRFMNHCFRQVTHRNLHKVENAWSAVRSD
jgi:hypothetical protein